ncbi:hypothetical protein SAMN04488062_102269 [Flavobacterium omnivorum]|uniref:Uncharacterized protein n=1 Tax=Flavobacterium omnivorum TaxID=178355 RepID=A0A1G7XDC9_9FLAO|nr:hypothetical protein [Flavobacterium omnivorum]SDG82285.1 hypothetical protein SAMN04488062_102269 [Flavobacterium omnivorum]
MIEIEIELDEKIKNLSIWNLSFQSILSVLLFTAENIDIKGDNDTAMDYISRLSLIFPLIKKYAQKEEITTTSISITKTGTKEYLEDVNFLISYAHFSMLMPQIHRETLITIKKSDNTFYLDFKNTDTLNSELIDKLYSFISLHFVLTFKDENEFKKYLNDKVISKNSQLNDVDFYWIKKIQEQYKKYFINIHVLPNEIFEDVTGATYDDYYSFIATLRAFSDYFINLARSYKNQITDLNSHEENEILASEYLEWSTCCLDFKTIGLFIGISELEKNVFDKLFSFYINIIDNNTGEKYQSNAFCGDGYFPPITLIDKSIIFSPHAMKYMLNINNILYSINKTKKQLFDDKISSHLEPTLINQLEYLFQGLKNIKIKKNINYGLSEIDMLLLSETEKVCIVIQVKTTIAPDSSRTVERVQGRTIEAKKQIDIFKSIDNLEKIKLVNKEFNCELKELKFINLIVVRSCAGTDKAWEINKTCKIVNYSFIANLLCKKIKNEKHSIINLEDEIANEQNELIKMSSWTIINETLKIDKYEIVFPNINFIDNNIATYNLKNLTCFPKLENSEF